MGEEGCLMEGGGVRVFDGGGGVFDGRGGGGESV